MEETLPISEIFTSWQGEGLLTGTPSVFLRVAGCHLRCTFCDTRYAWETISAVKQTVNSLVTTIQFMAENPKFPKLIPECTFLPIPAAVTRIFHVVITGGEPLLFPALIPLTQKLRTLGFHITVETSATRFLPLSCNLWSLSPKLLNSLPAFQENPAFYAQHKAHCQYSASTLQKFTASQTDYQLKFVINTPEDISEIQDFMKAYPFLHPDRVLLMAQGKTRNEILSKERWLQELAAFHKYRISPRAHLFWFNQKQGV
ncbi:MAG: 7-carboxy-7-deazaguanine synthase QueE [Planctomycetia bacterium]|nr:7-carboxy-7-deazaguanine synthase QueE [Planctomycetia bacterium]